MHAVVNLFSKYWATCKGAWIYDLWLVIWGLVRILDSIERNRSSELGLLIYDWWLVILISGLSHLSAPWVKISVYVLFFPYIYFLISVTWFLIGAYIFFFCIYTANLWVSSSLYDISFVALIFTGNIKPRVSFIDISCSYCRLELYCWQIKRNEVILVF